MDDEFASRRDYESDLSDEYDTDLDLEGNQSSQNYSENSLKPYFITSHFNRSQTAIFTILFRFACQ